MEPITNLGIKNTYLAIKSSIENLTHQKLQSLGLNYVDKDNDGIDDRNEAFVDADGDGKDDREEYTQRYSKCHIKNNPSNMSLFTFICISITV